jgi:hypothetical protein
MSHQLVNSGCGQQLVGEFLRPGRQNEQGVMRRQSKQGNKLNQGTNKIKIEALKRMETHARVTMINART